MYCIALCDDEEKELDRIEGFLARYQDRKKSMEYRIRRFTDAETLLGQVRKQSYIPDLILLDIFMSGKNGMEAAAEIRKLGFFMPIVFLTTSKDHALYAYEVDAIQYLVKPVEQDRFFHAMDFAMGRMEKRKESQIVLKVAGGVCQLEPDDIVYCESQKNYQILYLTNGLQKVRMTAENLWKILEKFSQFGKCGRSYILNMNHIISAEREEIAMDNKSTIYIPRNKAAEFKKAYFSYYFEQGDGEDEALYETNIPK